MYFCSPQFVEFFFRESSAKRNTTNLHASVRKRERGLHIYPLNLLDKGWLLFLSRSQKTKKQEKIKAVSAINRIAHKHLFVWESKNTLIYLIRFELRSSFTRTICCVVKSTIKSATRNIDTKEICATKHYFSTF